MRGRPVKDFSQHESALLLASVCSFLSSSEDEGAHTPRLDDLLVTLTASEAKSPSQGGGQVLSGTHPECDPGLDIIPDSQEDLLPGQRAPTDTSNHQQQLAASEGPAHAAGQHSPLPTSPRPKPTLAHLIRAAPNPEPVHQPTPGPAEESVFKVPSPRHRPRPAQVSSNLQTITMQRADPSTRPGASSAAARKDEQPQQPELKLHNSKGGGPGLRAASPLKPSTIKLSAQAAQALGASHAAAIPLSPVKENTHKRSIALVRSPGQPQPSPSRRHSAGRGSPNATVLTGDKIKVSWAGQGDVGTSSHQPLTAGVKQLVPPMNLEEKMARWDTGTGAGAAQLGHLPAQLGQNRFGTAGAFPGPAACIPARLPGAAGFQTTGFAPGLAQHIAAGTGAGAGAGTATITPAHAPPVRDGAAGRSGASTPWDSATWDALDSLERKVAVAAPLPLPGQPTTTTITTTSNPPGHAPAASGVAMLSALDLVRNPALDNPAPASHPEPPVPAPPAAGRFRAGHALARPSPPGFGLGPPGDVIIVPASPSSISRVPETTAPSNRTTPLSAGMLSAMDLAMDQLDQAQYQAQHHKQEQQQAPQQAGAGDGANVLGNIPAGAAARGAVQVQPQPQPQAQAQAEPRLNVFQQMLDSPATDSRSTRAPGALLHPVQPNAATPLPVKQLTFTPIAGTGHGGGGAGGGGVGGDVTAVEWRYGSLEDEEGRPASLDQHLVGAAAALGPHGAGVAAAGVTVGTGVGAAEGEGGLGFARVGHGQGTAAAVPTFQVPPPPLATWGTVPGPPAWPPQPHQTTGPAHDPLAPPARAVDTWNQLPPAPGAWQPPQDGQQRAGGLAISSSHAVQQGQERGQVHAHTHASKDHVSVYDGDTQLLPREVIDAAMAQQDNPTAGVLVRQQHISAPGQHQGRDDATAMDVDEHSGGAAGAKGNLEAAAEQLPSTHRDQAPPLAALLPPANTDPTFTTPCKGSGAAPGGERGAGLEGVAEDDDDEEEEEEAVEEALVQGLSQAATQARLNMLFSQDRKAAAATTAGGGGGGEDGTQAGVRPGNKTPVPGTPNTPTPPTQISRRLEDYLPEEVVQVYRVACGVTAELYQWQAECLMLPGVLRGRNLVFSAPTSAGKTIVYEVLALRRLLTTQRPFMLVLPTVALCHQKAKALERLMAPMNKQVKHFYGGIKSGTYIDSDTGAVICTIEMANKIINRMLEEDSLSQLGALVVDELHMVGDNDRGYLLELLLTKLRYATMTMTADHGAEAGSHDLVLHEGVQVIGMSATMPNVPEVARWLGAELYQTSFRPVPLMEYVKSGKELKDGQLQVVRELSAPDPAWDSKSDPDHVALLARETVFDGHSCLIFCASKAACENVARLVADRLGVIPEKPTSPGKRAQAGETTPDVCGVTPGQPAHPPGSRAAILQELTALNGDANLVERVSKGVAYHHRGLSSEECLLVEVAYKSGAVSVLCCTSTMAVGVNLPARRVIFRHPYTALQTNPIDVATYRQMSGRAGRAGIDEAGESILITQPGYDEKRLAKLITESSEPISSCLVEGKRGMKRAMLEVVVCGAVCYAEDVERYIRCTLLAATSDYQGVVAEATKQALKWLCSHDFITWEPTCKQYVSKALGKATLEAGMDPSDALLVKEDLANARKGFVMATDLHLTYLVVPPRIEYQINWERYFDLTDRLQKLDQAVMTLVGVKPAFLLNKFRGATKGQSKEKLAEQERVAKKFFAALVLNDVINEMPLNDVVDKYGLAHKGPIQDLQERASKTAGMVAAFCSQLGWGDLELLITKFHGRVHSGVQADLVALTEIPGIGKFRARVLFKAGLRTPEALAACDVTRITEVLVAGCAKGSRSETQLQGSERRAAKIILRGARELLAAKAQELQAQAQAALAAFKGSQISSTAGTSTAPSGTQQARVSPPSATAPPTSAGAAAGRLSRVSPASAPGAVAERQAQPQPQVQQGAGGVPSQQQRHHQHQQHGRPAADSRTGPAAAEVHDARASSALLSGTAQHQGITSVNAAAGGVGPAGAAEQHEPAPKRQCTDAAWDGGREASDKPPELPAPPPPPPNKGTSQQQQGKGQEEAGQINTSSLNAQSTVHSHSGSRGTAAAAADGGRDSKGVVAQGGAHLEGDGWVPRKRHATGAAGGPPQVKSNTGPAAKPTAPLPPPPPITSLPDQGVCLLHTLHELQLLYSAIKKLGRCAFTLCFCGPDNKPSNPNALKLPNPPGMKHKGPATPLMSAATAPASSRDVSPSVITSTTTTPGTSPAGAGTGLGGTLGGLLADAPAEKLPFYQGDVEGAAFSLQDDCCYYVYLGHPGQGRPADDPYYELLALMLRMLCDKHIVKVTSYWKHQMKSLAAASATWPVLPTSPGAKPLPEEVWCLGGPLIDVVISSWVCDPKENDSLEPVHGRTGASWHTKLEESLRHTSGHEAVHEALACIPSAVHLANHIQQQQQQGGGGAGQQATAWDALKLEGMKRAALSRKMYEKSESVLTQQELMKPLCDLEMPMVKVIASMEMWGMAVDLQVMVDQRQGLAKREKQLEAHIFKACGRRLNLSSPAEVSELLYQKLAIPVPPEAMKGRNPSTAAAALEEILDAHPVVPLILEYRKVNKLLSMLDSAVHDARRSATPALLSCMRSAATTLIPAPGGDGAGAAVKTSGGGGGRGGSTPLIRMRGTILQTATVSGRLAMDEPNLQVSPNCLLSTPPTSHLPSRVTSHL